MLFRGLKEFKGDYNVGFSLLTDKHIWVVKQDARLPNRKLRYENNRRVNILIL
ncbi:hypothetical protein SPRA44_650011 [Serratia proteamaculans]|nr:hypothetical protein SPRA44_650011 [Serratia proteamaculans]